MRSAKVIKVLHSIITAVLLVVVIGGYFLNRTTEHDVVRDDRIAATRKLSDSLYLYVTVYDKGNATVRDVYRYYLAGKLPASNMMAELAGKAPFLVADNGDAEISAQNDDVKVSITGRVWDFNNSLVYGSEDDPHFITLDFSAMDEKQEATRIE